MTSPNTSNGKRPSIPTPWHTRNNHCCRGGRDVSIQNIVGATGTSRHAMAITAVLLFTLGISAAQAVQPSG